ncbi:50S ribosomal protein L3 [Rhodothermus profundi]|uniref:Large ribosomal subunit protein uL3 n=1 Tax=Rhodothermus profundi TaxID=633813 RepID=A0A1M6X0U5_9BACT|nr:50S ribosomal protein L3 [Rhodothermus profundi]SHK99617.1 LSU ribosomal protein L3P [Rhodothermus profundi]
MSGMLGRKIGMTQVFDEAGNCIPCTIIQAEPNAVVQVKTAEGKDGYDAVQLGYGERKLKRTTKAMLGHFQKAGVSPKRVLREFKNFVLDVKPGDEVRLEQLFEEGELIDVVGISKGRGFQGVVKRHGFAGVGTRTHGQHNRERAPGSIGASSFPSHVFKGMRMAGRMGNQRVKVKNLEVIRIFPEHHLILVKGAVPGPRNGIVELHKKVQ